MGNASHQTITLLLAPLAAPGPTHLRRSPSSCCHPDLCLFLRCPAAAHHVSNCALEPCDGLTDLEQCSSHVDQPH